MGVSDGIGIKFKGSKTFIGILFDSTTFPPSAITVNEI